MNERNHDYLSRQLKYTGFGEGHVEALKEKMAQGPPDFVLFHQAEFGKDNVVATLQFKKSEESEMYFFNRYSLMLKNEKIPDDTMKQTFYMGNNQDNITLKEAYNLMSGRAIHKEMTPKEGEKYNAWLQLDFKENDTNGNFKVKQFHPNYGYELTKALSAHAIKELTEPQQMKNIMESLERGNRQAVTIDVKGKEQKMYIEAAPQFKSLNFYDASMKRVNAQTLYEGNKNAVKESRDVSSEAGVVRGETAKESAKEQSRQNQKADDDDGPGEGKKNNKRKRQRIS